jgi:Tol biopolymer transport system component
MDNMRFHKTAALVLALVLAMVVLAPAIAQQNGQAEVMLQAAQNKQLVDGDLGQAIQMYKKILSQYSANRPVAAKALVEMGDCYEKLGKSEALKAYQRVLRDYADQSVEANEARARLAALEHGGTHEGEMVVRRVWADSHVDVEGGVAPSGRFLSYVDWDRGDLAVHDLITGQNRRVTHKGPWSKSEDFAENSVPSPDGKKIAYAWCKYYYYQLRVIGADGSNTRVLYNNPKVGYLEPKSWSPDGKEIIAAFFVGPGDKVQIAEASVADGSIRILKEVRGQNGVEMHAMFSPGGHFVAYDVPSSENPATRDIHIMSNDGGNDMPLVQSPSDDYLLGWAPDGKDIIFASDRTGTYAVWGLHVVNGKPSGSPRLLKTDASSAWWPLGLTRDGSLYYGIDNEIDDEYVASFDFSSGKLLKAPAPISQEFTGRTGDGAWSPDGKDLAYLKRSVRPSSDSRPIFSIVIRSLETGRERIVVPKLQFVVSKAGISWSADGRSVYVTGTNGKRLHGVYRIDAQTGDASILFRSTPQLGFSHAEELTQGNVFVLRRQELGKNIRQLVTRNLKSGQEQVLFHLAEPADISGFAVSPDGRQVAFTTTDEPGSISELRVVPVAGGNARLLYQLKPPKVVEHHGAVAWTRDGKYIVFGERSGLWSQRNVEFYEISAQGGQPRDLGLSMPSVQRLHIHPDGHRLLFESDRNSAEVWVIHNILPALKASR